LHEVSGHCSVTLNGWDGREAEVGCICVCSPQKH
jgi:hypothetical protein